MRSRTRAGSQEHASFPARFVTSTSQRSYTQLNSASHTAPKMVCLHHHSTIPHKKESVWVPEQQNISTESYKVLGSTVSLGKQLCHSCPAIIHSDHNPVLYKQEWINSSNHLPYRINSWHITRTTRCPYPIHCPDLNHCTDSVHTAQELYWKLGLLWRVQDFPEQSLELYTMQVNGCKWHLLARTEDDTNTILWVWPTALIQKN